MPQSLNKLIKRDSRAEYQERKRFLALQNIAEWTVEEYFSCPDGHFRPEKSVVISWRNNVSGEIELNMPASLDRLGFLVNLKCLKMDDNYISFLPKSVTRLTALEILCCCRNNIKDLPEDIGNLKNLRRLKMSSNSLRSLPESIGECKKLLDIDLATNKLQEVPTCIANLISLHTLNLHNNEIKLIPLEMGFLKNLSELNLMMNPLKDVPFDVLTQAPKEILWACREVYLRKERGIPPAVHRHRSGINKECLELTVEFKERIGKKLKEARDGKRRLDLQLMGLKTVPKEVFSVQLLNYIDLSRNCLGGDTVDWPDTLSSLETLIMRDCGICKLSPSMQNLTCLTQLSLENNSLEELPNALTRLYKLKQLHLTNNKLFLLPDSISRLTALEVLVVENNRLCRLPSSLGSLTNLKHLCASENCLREVGDFVSEISSLRRLDLCRNFLFTVSGIGVLRLESLKVSNNRIEVLSDDLFYPNLHKSLQELWIDSNNLLELPRSLTALADPDGVHFELNPLQNPPPSLMLEEGISTVMNYIDLRFRRIDQMLKLLEKEKFLVDKGRLCPLAENVIAGNSGYLLPTDLKEFDEAVNLCLNGSFFLYSQSVKDAVRSITVLRQDREYSTHRAMLETLINILWAEAKSESDLCNDACFQDGLLRRWGRNRERVNCFAISESCLFNVISEGTPSVYSLVKDALPDLTRLFGLNNEQMTMALNLQSPYGRVAAFERIPYIKCECMDDKGFPINHASCTLNSIVIVRKIYSPEEAERRLKEDDALGRYFSQLESKIDKWAKGPDGVRSVNAEVTRRTKTVTRLLKETRHKCKTAKSNELSTAEDLLKIALRRKKEFKDGKPFALHRIETDDHAAKVLSAAERGLLETKENIAKLEDEILALVKRKEKLDRKEMRRNAVADMKKKHCFHIFAKVQIVFKFFPEPRIFFQN